MKITVTLDLDYSDLLLIRRCVESSIGLSVDVKNDLMYLLDPAPVVKAIAKSTPSPF